MNGNWLQNVLQLVIHTRITKKADGSVSEAALLQDINEWAH